MIRERHPIICLRVRQWCHLTVRHISVVVLTMRFRMFLKRVSASLIKTVQDKTHPMALLVYSNRNSGGGCGRVHPGSYSARLNSIYPAFAPARTYVASRDNLNTGSRSPPHQAPTASGDHPSSSVTGSSESHSGESSDESSNDTPPEDPEVSQVGCCGLLSPRRPRATAPWEVHPQPSPPTTRPPKSTGAATHTPPSTSPFQDILELSAVVRSDTP